MTECLRPVNLSIECVQTINHGSKSGKVGVIVDEESQRGGDLSKGSGRLRHHAKLDLAREIEGGREYIGDYGRELTEGLREPNNSDAPIDEIEVMGDQASEA